MKLKLLVKVYEKYKGKTKFDFWTGIEVGDVLEISKVLEPSKRNGDKLYADYLIVTNLTQNKTFSESNTNINKYLGNMAIGEIDESDS